MTAERKNSKEALGIRLADMLTRLNNGECLDVQELAEHYGITVRSAQRDINRLSPLLTPHRQTLLPARSKPIRSFE